MNQSAAFTTRQVLHLAPGITARQLQWWDERGILSPVQFQHSRQYSAADVFGVLLIHELKERGFTLRQIRVVQRGLRRQQFQMPTERHRWLLTNGERVVLLAHPDVVIAFLEQRRSPAFVLVSLEALQRKMEEGIARLRGYRVMKKEPQSAGAMAAGEVREERRA